MEFYKDRKSYFSNKVYPDGSSVITYKYGLDLSDVDKSRKGGEVVKLANLKRSARRVFNTITDLCKCNTFDWFLTLTFSSDSNVVEDRLDDQCVRNTFQKWREYVKDKFPDMYYVAVPEYHKKGGLHYHLLVGGISFQDFNPTFSHFSNCMGNDIPIYSCGIFPYGFNSVSEIQNKERCESYILKYITKADLDLRFYNKKRYHCSHNIKRPVCHKWSDDFYYTPEEISDMYDYVYAYGDFDKNYFVFDSSI